MLHLLLDSALHCNGQMKINFHLSITLVCTIFALR